MNQRDRKQAATPKHFVSAMPPEQVATKPPIYKRKWFIVVIVLIFLSIIGSCSGGGKNKGADLDTAQQDASQTSTAAVTEDASQVGTATAVELTPTTEFLEYSNKDVDPLTLVRCNEQSAQVSALNGIDLSTLGPQTVNYQVVSNGMTTDHVVTFTIRDTRAPSINLSIDNPSVNLGEEYNPHDAVASVTDEVDGDLPFVELPPEPLGVNVGTEQIYETGWYTLEGAIDPWTPATYPIMLTAADKHGNMVTKEIRVTVVDPAQTVKTPAATQTAATHTYIANTHTMKFHVPGCFSAEKIDPSNRWEVTTTREEMLNEGYSPCGNCNP